MKQIIAMHGWSGDSRTWQRWEGHFQDNQWEWLNADRGYGYLPATMPHWTKGSRPCRSMRRAFIAHSLGLHLINQHTLATATDIVLIGSFSRFLPSGPESRHIQTTIRAMQQRIGTDKENVMLLEFRKQASSPEPINNEHLNSQNSYISKSGRKKLNDDLLLLLQTNGLPSTFPPKARVLVIQGDQDAIVHPSSQKSLIEDLNDHLETSPTNWKIPKTGHFVSSQIVVNKVQEWLCIDT